MAKRRWVLVAIDAANHAIDAKDNGASLNFVAGRKYAEKLGEVRQAGIYGVRLNNLPERERQQIIALKKAGFDRVMIRPLRQRGDGSTKSDIDTVIAMDIWGAAVRKQVDVVVLFSGDSDFVPLVERLVEAGIEVHVVGPDRCTAWELAAAATCFLYASELEGLVQPIVTGFAPPAAVVAVPVEPAVPSRNGASVPAANRPG